MSKLKQYQVGVENPHTWQTTTLGGFGTTRHIQWWHYFFSLAKANWIGVNMIITIAKSHLELSPDFASTLEVVHYNSLKSCCFFGACVYDSPRKSGSSNLNYNKLSTSVQPTNSISLSHFACCLWGKTLCTCFLKTGSSNNIHSVSPSLPLKPSSFPPSIFPIGGLGNAFSNFCLLKISVSFSRKRQKQRGQAQ